MILFASTIGLSAFLLFLVQPIIAKQILPWFGGSAAVWTTCMVFFQVVLLAGYFYSDLVIRKLDGKRQAMVHGVLLLVSLAALPISASDSFKPADADNPIGRILLLLAVTIGLPYLMLSTTGPLVQAWFARRFSGTPTAASVWRLYALSNVASMLALIAYPPLIEPNASSRIQSVGWSVGYAVFVALTLASAWVASRHRENAGIVGSAAGSAASAVTGDTTNAATVATTNASALDEHNASMGTTPTPPTAPAQLLWLTLAALGSVLLLSVTTHITQNVASIPFLWVLPLSLYLISFILTFDGKGWYWQHSYRLLASLMTVLLVGGLIYRVDSDWKWADGLAELLEPGLMHIEEAVPLYSLGLFVLCMFCHGELVARRPAPAYLTRFYLMVSLGGAIGGLLVGIAAPMVFSNYWELPAALLAASVLVVMLSPTLFKPVALIAVLGCGWLGHEYFNQVRENVVEQSRNFYGTLTVKAAGRPDHENAKLRLLHGVITHGEQYRSEKNRRLPTTYYGETSGVGIAIDALRTVDNAAPQRVGLIGLGVGTLASYGRAGDTYRIYELNPAVLELAQRQFTYLKDSPANIETPLGDARLVLEREAGQKFDLLAIDAFSSDSIPVHLITREAMAIYLRHLREGGVVAFHITNRYLDLKPITRQLADESKMQAVLIADDPPDDHPLYRSDWVLITSNTKLLDELKQRKKGEAIEANPKIRAWTDDYNNLFDVLK